MSTMHENFIAYFSLIGITSGSLLPASLSKIQLSCFLFCSCRLLLILLSFRILIDCSENSFTKFAVNLESSVSSRGKHFSIFKKSPTAFATPMPPILLYAGSVLVIFEDSFLESTLILTVTLCPIVGETTTDVLGCENLIFSSISFATPSASSFSICLPALLSMIIPSSFNVE